VVTPPGVLAKLGALGGDAPGVVEYGVPPMPPGAVIVNEPNVTELNPPSGALVPFTEVAVPPAPTTMVRV
jgi:hypothetical protein